MDLAEHLRTLEESLQDGAVRKDAERVGALLSDGFREFGGSGRVFSKAEIVAELQEETTVPILMEEFFAQMLAEGVALVTYRSKRGTVASLRSSVWVLEGEAWRMVFHQGTRLGA